MLLPTGQSLHIPGEPKSAEAGAQATLAPAWLTLSLVEDSGWKRPTPQPGPLQEEPVKHGPLAVGRDRPSAAASKQLEEKQSNHHQACTSHGVHCSVLAVHVAI